jgi:protein O-mannosyl-transferase
MEELAPGLLVAALSVSIYLGALRNPFVYDDRITIVENPSIRHLGDIRFVLRFDLFRPLVNLSFAVDHALWDLDPVGYHLTNILLHALNVVVVFTLLWSIVQDCCVRLQGAWEVRQGSARLIAVVAAALFAVHPMMTESVGYVSGRSDVLAGTLFLLALLAMRTGLVRARARWIAVSLVLFVLALLSKEVAIMFPFLVLAYDRLILRGSALERRQRLLRLHLPLISTVTLIGLARVTIFLVVENVFSAESVVRMFRYLTLQFEVIWKYVRLLMLPVRQSIAHNVTGFVVVSVLGAFALGLSCVLAYRARRGAPLLSFGVAWFLLLLVPTSSVLPLQYPMAEHRVYLASIGLFLVAATAFARLVQGLRDRPFRPRVLLYAASLVVLGGLAGLTVSRNVVWANPVALWRDAVIKAPRWDTYMAFGNALRDAGNCEAALVAYDQARRLEPDRLLPLAARWACLVMLGKDEDAIKVVRHIHRVDPEFARLCQEARALAPHIISMQTCVVEFRAAFGPRPSG